MREIEMVFWLRFKIGSVRFTFTLNVLPFLLCVAAVIGLHLITGWNAWICAAIVFIADVIRRALFRRTR